MPGTVLNSVVMLLSIKIPTISAYIDPFALTKVHSKGTDLNSFFSPIFSRYAVVWPCQVFTGSAHSNRLASFLIC